MKLIIDIDEEEFRRIKEYPGAYYIDIFNTVRRGKTLDAILDTIGAEITEEYRKHLDDYDMVYLHGMEYVLNTVSKYLEENKQ